MNDYNISYEQASIAIVAQQMERMGIWKEIERQVHIQQKTVKHRPIDKLQDAFLNILRGGRGIVEINSRIRPDRVLQALFGRNSCAEQSNVSRTLSSCTVENVAQLRSALRTLYIRHSQACRHDYRRAYQVLDIDFSGVLAGRQGELVTRGYFNGQAGGRGRQIGRVLASRYDELLSERLYAGNQQLAAGLRQLVEDAEVILNLNVEHRQHTVLRLDAGGGQDADVNWMLERGYKLLVKMFSGSRARQMAENLPSYAWVDDPKTPGRACAWITDLFAYAQPTRQVAVRVRQKGRTYYGILVTNASDALLSDLSATTVTHPQTALFHLLYAYDRRMGALETHNRGDKQGLGLSKRNKRSAAAQEMLVLLAQLAHNLLVWLGRRLKSHLPPSFHLGMLRLVRDVLSINGLLRFDHHGHLYALILNAHHPFADAVFRAFQPEWHSHHLSLILHKF